MSRVFEALRKAGEEKEQPFESPAEAPSDLREATPAEMTIETTAAIAEWSLGKNGQAHNGHVLAPDPRTKSWRERLEELFFGWDLQRYTTHPIVALERDSAAAEQYKILREQVKRLRREADIRVFAVTSPVKRDGKSTVAVNLAAALSLDYEENVLLVDADLRAPSVHRHFQLKPSPGLADFLASDAPVNDVSSLLRETFLPGLTVLPAGAPTNFSSELLAKDRMRQLIEELRRQFSGHHIVIDTPPVLSTSDPIVVARHVDGVLLVVRARKTPRDYLLKSVQLLNTTKLMGVVFNAAELGMASKYYYYSYVPSN